MTLLLRPWLRARTRSLLPVEKRPLPQGDPVFTVPGADPDRVLVIGSGPVSGAGIPSHDAALPGTTARALAARTGHGAVVEARGRRELRLEGLREVLSGAQLQRFDALVLVVGLFDAAEGVSRRRWSRALDRHLTALRDRGARDAVVLLTRIPSLSSITGRRGVAVRVVDWKVARMNAVLQRAATRPGVAFAVLPEPDADAPLASPEWYRRCGDSFAAAVAPMLAAHRRER